jgi:hypothetical protein
MSQSALLLAGCVASCATVLVLAGASKLYRGERGIDSGSAIRRTLRMPRRRWRRAEAAAGGLECLTGALVCAGVYPVAGCAAMATFGAVFCVLLGYARIKRVPGGCGCMSWRTPAGPAAEQITWRAIARSAMLLGGGVAGAVAGAASPGAFHRVPFAAGFLAGALIFVLLSTRLMARTPICHRRLWRPASSTLRALTEHDAFAAMTASAGPFGDVAGYRRDGCTEEYWLRPATQPGSARAVVFRVSYPTPGAPPAVHASLRDVSVAPAARPTRTITVPFRGLRILAVEPERAVRLGPDRARVELDGADPADLSRVQA